MAHIDVGIYIERLRFYTLVTNNTLDPSIDVADRPSVFFRDDPTGKIEGYVYNIVDGSPLPVKRRIFLIRDQDALRMRTGTSDPVTGYYKFENLERGKTYSVIVHDIGQTLNATIEDKITPDPMT